jgi:hypothetical protein
MQTKGRTLSQSIPHMVMMKAPKRQNRTSYTTHWIETDIEPFESICISSSSSPRHLYTVWGLGFGFWGLGFGV